MPNLSDILKNTRKSIPWAAIASVVAENVGVRVEATKEIVAQLQMWGSFLSKHAIANWSSSLLSPIACEVPGSRCPSTAVVRCQGCGKRCCLAHVRLSFLAEGICEACIEEKMGIARPVREGDRLQAALRVMGLHSNASWSEVKSRYRKLAVKHNADVPQSREERAENTKRLKAINAAYAVLRDHFEQEAA